MDRFAEPSGTIDPRHLEAASSGLLREAMRAHPGRLVRLTRFFVAGVAEPLSRFLCDEARYRREYRLFSSTDPVDERGWASADDRDRLSTVRRLAGADGREAIGPGALAYLQVRRGLETSRFRPFLEAASGLRLGDAWDVGAFRMEPGDFVRPHRYDSATCELRLEVFLSPNWDVAFGGELCVIDHHERITRIPPVFNTAVILDASVGNTYLVGPIRPDAGDAPRITLGASLGPAGGTAAAR